MSEAAPLAGAPSQTGEGAGKTTREAAPNGRTPGPAWTTHDSTELYAMNRWGKGLFGVNDAGHMVVRPDRSPEREIDLHDVIGGLRERGIGTPVLLRFSDVLGARLDEIRGAFDNAIDECGYDGSYACIYPIKVNQQRQLCEEVRDHGARLGFGLEAGSKPELLAVLGLTVGHDDMPIVCNGFKDAEYLETVVLAAKLGRHIIPVVERTSELRMLVEIAKRYGVRPRLGLRLKLSTRGLSRWDESAGLRGKFGLVASEAIASVDFLREAGMLDCLRMIHAHVGSQLGDIRRVKALVGELTHFYTELVKLGAPLDTIDVGGGMGVDYDGTQTATDSSINYTVAEYAIDVVSRVQAGCDDAGVAHPRILSESGRAMVAHASVLVVDVLGSMTFDAHTSYDEIKALIAREGESETPQPVFDLLEAWDASAGSPNLLEVYHDAQQAREEAMSLFGLGYMTLPMRAAVEQMFRAVGATVLTRLRRHPERKTEELERLERDLSDICFCNFSLFQSLPDHWAIDQLFPICPISRLDERPTRKAVLADITCDSDGKMDRFVGPEGPARLLDLHELREGESYDLGIFLLGAYQEILGDLHNLFGDTHAVHVSLDESGAWRLDDVVEGDTVSEVLGYVQFDHRELRRVLRRNLEEGVRRSILTVPEAKSLLRFYEDGLDGYTYLEE